MTVMRLNLVRRCVQTLKNRIDYSKQHFKFVKYTTYNFIFKENIYKFFLLQKYILFIAAQGHFKNDSV